MRKLIASILVLTILAGPAGATPWNIMGPRALGMGGAYTAIAEGPVGSYWNPAGLGQVGNTNGLQAHFGARADATGTVLQGANDLNRINHDCNSLGASNGLCTQARITDAIDRMNQPGNGVLADLGGGLGLKFGRLAVFANGFGNIGAVPVVQLGGTTLNLNANNSRLIINGITWSEVGLGYGREIGSTGLMLGANVKALFGKVGYGELRVVADDPGSTKSLDDYNKNVKSSVQPGIDAGLLWDVRQVLPNVWWRPRIGIMGRNLNNPKFKQSDAAMLAGRPSKYSLEGQGRAGLALSPFNWWHLAADVDLTKNLTPLSTHKSQYLSLGTEINVFNRTWINIPLRAGVINNMAANDSKVAYTAGFGLNFLHLIFDVSGSMSAKKATIESSEGEKKVPNNFAAAASFSFLFGGREFKGEESAPAALSAEERERVKAAAAAAQAEVERGAK